MLKDDNPQVSEEEVADFRLFAYNHACGGGGYRGIVIGGSYVFFPLMGNQAKGDGC